MVFRDRRTRELASKMINSQMMWTKIDDRFTIPHSGEDMKEIQFINDKYDITKKIEGRKNPLDQYIDYKSDLLQLNYNAKIERAIPLFGRYLNRPEGTFSKRNFNRKFTTDDFYTSKYIRSIQRQNIDTAPTHVLDAPGIVDDFYLNTLDWSDSNILAIGLLDTVYIWSAETQTSSTLVQLNEGRPPISYVSSVKFFDGHYSLHLAIGTSDGFLQIWDVFKKIMITKIDSRKYLTQKSLNIEIRNRISSIATNGQMISFGGRCGMLQTHDLRDINVPITVKYRHKLEICGAEWNKQGGLLATGGNDNIVNVWDSRLSTKPVFKVTKHKAAIKALGWCPNRSSTLATGGGSIDKTLCIWNTSMNVCMESVKTSSQICSLKWSKVTNELVTSHGFSRNEIIIWAYPKLLPVSSFQAHRNRILHIAISPAGHQIASASSDESLKFWELFKSHEKDDISYISSVFDTQFSTSLMGYQSFTKT